MKKKIIVAIVLLVLLAAVISVVIVLKKKGKLGKYIPKDELLRPTDTYSYWYVIEDGIAEPIGYWQDDNPIQTYVETVEALLSGHKREFDSVYRVINEETHETLNEYGFGELFVLSSSLIK